MIHTSPEGMLPPRFAPGCPLTANIEAGAGQDAAVMGVAHKAVP